MANSIGSSRIMRVLLISIIRIMVATRRSDILKISLSGPERSRFGLKIARLPDVDRFVLDTLRIDNGSGAVELEFRDSIHFCSRLNNIITLACCVTKF